MIGTTKAIEGYRIGIFLGLDTAGLPILKCTHKGENFLLTAAGSAWAPQGNNWDTWTGKEFVCTGKSGSGCDVLLLGPLTDSAPDESANPRETIHLKAAKELILECGDAKIHLRADGKIVVLGGYIVQRSRGVHKIRGASVQIN